MELKHKELIAGLTLEQKCSLLSGMDFWQTEEIKGKIPAAFLSDGPSGLRKQAKAADHLGLNPSIPAVCMPSSATVANSWDPELAYLVGKTIGEEASAAEVTLLLGPGVNMKRNPRCGRNFEYFSEDPYLAGKMAGGYIRGVQSNGIGSCIKHYAANNQEIRRMTSDSIVDERALREIYLEAFEIAIKESNPAAVMTSYNKLNGIYANENEHLLREILRNEWGYNGVVVSDWGGDNDRVAALKASSDLEMPTSGGETDAEVVAAVKEGKIAESYVDESVDRLLEMILKASENLKKASREFDKDAHHLTAQKVAEESIVLLKNNDHLLPLAAKTKVAIVGDFAKDARYQGAGSSVVNPLHVDQILDVIKEYPLSYVGFEPGFKRYGKKSQRLIDKAVKLAEKADVVLLFCGLDEVTEAEGMDRPNIRLPGNQRDLIAALYHTGKKVVLVMECGSVVEMPYVSRVDAIVHAYLSGEAGARAILNVITGKVNPSGKLAESVPFGYADCPSADHFGKSDRTIEYRESIFIGYRYYNSSGAYARIPFGYGLSYTKFAYRDLEITDKGVKFKVKNIGKVDGKEIAQLYVGKRHSFVFRPRIELKGFVKVALKAGEEKSVEIPFDEYTFRYFDISSKRFETEGGEYQIFVGSSSKDLLLDGVITKEGTVSVGPYDVEKIRHYMKGEVREVPDAEFKEILGSDIPEKDLRFIKKHRIEVDYNTSVSDLRYAKGWTGRLTERVIRHLIGFLRWIGKRTTANTLVMGVYYNPVRAFSRMTGAAISMAQLDGLIMMFNGHFFKGLHHFFKMGRARKKAQKAKEKAEKGK
ncbi:MAG: glycoside hydrolase family 3 C-terminal domain-containing protein [Candidatus Enteromonas sp.]|jgi:beta-glucosidase|nr:glycoside hydrolase family 3 C-terminal domain-containing protein [Candidatus Enteromonas sp.]MEE3442192.1 glycoside hydrolase family 3 C-terminal domain-containing protein [Candidatus Enteromonas sp.]